MELERGYWWVRYKEGNWTPALVEDDETKGRYLQILGEKKRLFLAKVNSEDVLSVRMVSPEAAEKNEENRARKAGSVRRPMQEIRSLYLVVNPKYHARQHRYIAHDDLSTAAGEACRLSKTISSDTFYVMEAKPIGHAQAGQLKE